MRQIAKRGTRAPRREAELALWYLRPCSLHRRLWTFVALLGQKREVMMAAEGRTIAIAVLVETISTVDETSPVRSLLSPMHIL